MTGNKSKIFTAVLLAAALTLGGCTENTPGSGGDDTTTTASAAAPQEAETSVVTAAEPHEPENGSVVWVSIRNDIITPETESIEVEVGYDGSGSVVIGTGGMLRKYENNEWRDVPLKDGVLMPDGSVEVSRDNPYMFTVSMSDYAEPLEFLGIYSVAVDAGECISEQSFRVIKDTPPLTGNDIEMYIEPNVFMLGADGFELRYRYVGTAEYAEYMFGCYYTLEKLENGEWREIPFSENTIFNDLGYIIGTVSPENSTPVSLSDNFYAEPLTEGIYRVKKDIEGITFYAEFEISGSAPRETTVAVTEAPEETASETTAETTASETTAAPAETTEEQTCVMPAIEEPAVLMIMTYDNYAWGYQQQVAVFADDGKCYTYSADEADDGIRNWEDGWYAAVYEKIIAGGECKEFDAGLLEQLLEFNKKLPEYEKLPIKKDDTLFMCDYGTKSLYGVYTGKDGEAHIVDIAGFGDSGAECIDSPEVRKFVNMLAESGYFSMTGYVFSEDGNLHEIYEVESEDGSIVLQIKEIQKDCFLCSLPRFDTVCYYVACDTSEYGGCRVGDKIEVMYSTMYRRYDSESEFVLYPYFILYVEDSEGGTLTLTIDEITEDGFACSLPWPYPAQYYVLCDPKEYDDYCVGDNVEVTYSMMCRKYDDEFMLAVYPVSIGPSSFQLEADVCYKPVIYLYPEEQTDVSVKLDLDGELTVTYPEYGDGWSVTAMPDGTLYDADGNEYSYLFWEGRTDIDYDFSSGFCVKGSDTAAFLREKLAYLGLTPREYNEFIVFWLPLMQDNEYNVISFQTDRYTDSAVLSVTPEPDTVLRVFMAFYPSDKPADIPEQQLEHTDRNGFTVIEWGGAR